MLIDSVFYYQYNQGMKNLLFSLLAVLAVISFPIDAKAQAADAVGTQIEDAFTDEDPAPAAPAVEKNDRADIIGNALETARTEPAATVVDTPALKTTAPTVSPQPQDFSLLQSQKIVKAVEIKGNKSISTANILAKIKTRVGEEYLQNVISDDIKRIYNMGYFADVSVDREDYAGGFRVIVHVVEKPIVDKITFSKLKEFRPQALQNKIKTKAGKFLDNKDLKDDVKTIEELYDKKGMTKVDVKVETDTDELTNKVKVHFVIKEGYRVKVAKVIFNGNNSYRSKRLMKVVKIRPAWLFNSGFLKEDVLKEDIDRLKGFYEKEGFVDAGVTYATEEGKNGRTNVIFTIQEGKRYYVDKVVVTGNKVFSEEEIFKAMKNIKPNAVFSRQKLSEDINAIQTLYFDKGYIFVKVADSASMNADTGKVELKLDIVEGEIAYINKVKIQGNDRTRDIVIRRELRLYPGDRFDGEKLRRTKERLRNLGYFEDVGYEIEDTDRPTFKDLVVQVQEAKTGSFSFGGGYSTVEQLVGFVDIQQRNFDITNWPSFTGGGQNLELRTELGSVTSNSTLSFTEPWLFDYPVSGGFDAYMTEHDKDSSIGYSYTEKRIGGDLRLGKEFSEYLSGGLTFRREDVKIGDLDDNVSADLKAEEGKNTSTTFGGFLQQDYRDSIINPTKGWYVKEASDIGIKTLGGEEQFYRFRLYSGYYVPLPNESVLEVMVRPGIVDSYGDTSKVPIFERYFAGGASTIRGYDERKVGPRDSVTDDPIGGNSLFVANVEYTIPLMEFIKLATFFDAGNVWPRVSDFFSTKLYSGVGFGLRIKTPIAPMKLDYGIPLDKPPGEDNREGKFYFSVGRAF